MLENQLIQFICNTHIHRIHDSFLYLLIKIGKLIVRETI